MPTLPNTISRWSGTTFNIRNAEVVDLDADNISCATFTQNGDTISQMIASAGLTDLQTKTQNITLATPGATTITGVVLCDELDTTTLSVSGDYVSGSTFKIDSTNNRVGINNLTPAYSLDVTGTANVTGDTKVGSVLTVDTTNSRLGINRTTPLYALDVSGTAYMNSTCHVGGNFDVNGNTLVVDASGGKVGINTAIPTFPLEVTGNTKITGTATITSNLTASGISTLGSTSVTGLSATAVAVTGNQTITGTLGVTGASTLGSVSSTGITISAPTTATYSGTAPTSGTIGYTNITSASTTIPAGSYVSQVSLTSGVWLVEGIGGYSLGTNLSYVTSSLSTTAGTHDYTRATTSLANNAGMVVRFAVSSVFALSTTTTVQLIANIGAGTCTAATTYIRYTRIA